MMPKMMEAEAAGKVGQNRLLICAEGFEPRSLEWLSRQNDEPTFLRSIILRYEPRKKDHRFDELLQIVESLTVRSAVDICDFHRFEPIIFERTFVCKLESMLSDVDCVTIDISVMSKLLIMMLLDMVREYNHTLRIIYSEPKDYAPSQEEYEQNKSDWSQFSEQPSFGVHDVIRTPMLSSVAMQRSPSLLIAFASFNEQLLPAVLNACNPSMFFIVNGRPPHLHWRERATQEIAAPLISDYKTDNPVNKDGALQRTTSTLKYVETFDLLADIYRQHCYSKRIIVAPSGSKMQSVACALFKICCPDVHVEYPTPESFFVPGYSSKEVVKIHEIRFDHFRQQVEGLSHEYGLKGEAHKAVQPLS